MTMMMMAIMMTMMMRWPRPAQDKPLRCAVSLRAFGELFRFLDRTECPPIVASSSRTVASYGPSGVQWLRIAPSGWRALPQSGLNAYHFESSAWEVATPWASSPAVCHQSDHHLRLCAQSHYNHRLPYAHRLGPSSASCGILPRNNLRPLPPLHFATRDRGPGFTR